MAINKPEMDRLGKLGTFKKTESGMSVIIDNTKYSDYEHARNKLLSKR